MEDLKLVPVRRRVLACLLGAAFTGCLPSSTAATFFADPVSGRPENPGTSEQPWGTLATVVASGKQFDAGDVLVLRSGYHGSVTIRGRNNGEVLIRGEAGARATLRNLVFRGAALWRVQGIEISPEAAPTFERLTMVRVESDCSGIVVEDCSLHTTPDASSWSANEWDTRACNGIDVAGPNNVIRGNHLLNVNFGISVTGARNLVERNIVENFSGDGLRGLGDYGRFEFNTVKNCYDVNGNHDDGFQSWSVGTGGVGSGVVRGIVLRGNRIVNYEDPAQPHRGTLQGIGCFDGFFEDWVIENNEILTDHWHGISLYGARNCRIVNNTVVDLNTTSPGPPWIRITHHKNGTASTGNLIRNNLATAFSVDAGAAVQDHNLVVNGYPRYFRDYSHGDLRLREGAPGIDAGSPEQAPSTDAAGLPRPLDGNGDGTAAWDLGAHEYVEPTADSDADGMIDGDELQAGTDPSDPTEVLRLNLQLDPGGDVVLAWPGVLHRRYALVLQDRLGGPGLVVPAPEDWWWGNGESLTARYPRGAANARFFRVLVLGP